LSGLALLFVLTYGAIADDLRAPATLQAGQAFTFTAKGSGSATLYLIGPDHVAKRDVTLGKDLQIESNDVRAAGRYQLIVCQSSCSSTTFQVNAAQPSELSFFLHPSRVPVSTPGSIDATAFVFDRYFNLVLAPASVDFKVVPASGAGFSRTAAAKNGVAWMKMDSTPHEGRVKVTAALGKAEEARVIQQVAAEACSIRMKVAHNGPQAIIETEPIRDCSGNALPDGTIVSFTKIDGSGKSTVDTPIKKGIAQTQFNVAGPARISVACGVVLGNEILLNRKL
jgi:hypothetical protein